MNLKIRLKEALAVGRLRRFRGFSEAVLKQLRKSPAKQTAHEDIDCSRPAAAHVEITSYCNFKCDFCPSETMARKKCNLPYELGEKFVREMYRKYGPVPVNLNIMGEPFVNPDIFRYFDLCNELGITIVLVTNFSLLDDKTAEKLFKYSNFYLVLSLQTPNAESYKMRHYSKMTFDEYFARVDELINLKFKYKSGCKIEIHIASVYPMLEIDPYIGIDSDADINPIRIFESKDKEKRWYINYSNHMAQLAKQIQEEDPEDYERQLQLSLSIMKNKIVDGELIVDHKTLVKRINDLLDGSCWGYMPLPDVYLRAKVFGLFGKDKKFLEQLWNPEKYYTYVDERRGHITCGVTSNIGLLSDGRLTPCCIDCEGDISLGHIADIDLDNAAFTEKRARVISNALIEPVCRRCMGYVVVACKAPLNTNKQKVVHYSYDWFQFGKGGRRWSKNLSTCFVYARINADVLVIKAVGNFITKDALYSFSISRYHNSRWTEEKSVDVSVKTGNKNVLIDCVFKYGEFYRIRISNPAIKSCDIIAETNYQNLGIAIRNMYIKKKMRE